MALIGNDSVLSKHPGRDCGGGAIGLGHNRGDFGKTSTRRGAFNGAAWEAKSGVPDGYRPPYTWVMPQEAGGLAARNTLEGSGALAATGAMGVNGEAALAGTSTLTASLQLIVSAVASLAGSGTLTGDVVAILNAVAALAGTGTVAATARATGHAAASVAGSGALTAVPTATGTLSADLTITAVTDTPSAEQIAAAVWEHILDGSITDAASASAYVRRTLSTGKFLALK